MRMPRISIAGLMGVVLVIALGLAALRHPSPIRAGVAFLVTRGALTLAVVGAICRVGKERAWWLGFALFGWGHLNLGDWVGGLRMPTATLLEILAPRLGVEPFGPKGAPDELSSSFSQAGHCLMSLLAATLGGLLALRLFGAQAPAADRREIEPRPEGRPRRGWWCRPAVIWPAGLLAAAGIGLAGLSRAPGTTAAGVYFATWGLLLLGAVGAIFGPRGRRAAWLGAALFGIGYMGLIFRRDDRPNWPHVATDRLLCSVRGYFPWVIQEVPDTRDAASMNGHIFKVLDRPITLHYPGGVPLRELIRSIEEATRGPGGHGLPIYVDPLGLQEAEKTMDSPVTIDLDGVTLRWSLTLALRQLGLYYQVGDGLLTITSASCNDGAEPPPVHDDPFLVVGHCLLALAAAGLGGGLAPLVCKS